MEGMEVFWFEWERDLAGYEIVTERSAGGGLLTGSPDAAGESKVIRARGGDRELMRLDEHLAMFKELAQARKTEAAAINFTNRYGLLNARPLGVGGPSLTSEPLEAWLGTNDAVHHMVVAGEHREWPILAHYFEERDFGRMSPKILGWSSRGPDLKIVPSSLRQAIFVQLVQAYAHALKVRVCQRSGCGRWYAYGSGTKRRASAKYCSGACRQMAFVERTA